MTRDALVLGPDRLILKTTIALHHGGISLNSYSARDSPAISHTPWYDKKTLRDFRIFFKKSTEQGRSFLI